MRYRIAATCLLLTFLTKTFGRETLTDSLSQQKTYFYSAKNEIEKMLNGDTALSYERAIFLMENAYLENGADYRVFQGVIDYHVRNILYLIKNAKYHFPSFNTDLRHRPMESPDERKDATAHLIANHAIYTYLKDTLFTVYYGDTAHIACRMPYTYSFNDPFGTKDWTNTEVMNLLVNGSGNCFALASLFKILAERLHTGASLCTAPGHIYITHADEKGIPYNVELSNGLFPGTGTMATLTYTTNEAISNDLALRNLDLKQSVALCLVYLAKGYEYKFGTKDNDFMLTCAEDALKYDASNLNAMLLKAEILEQRLVGRKKTISQLHNDKVFKEYEKLLCHLYESGYREMPADMKNLLIKSWTRDKGANLPPKDNTPAKYNHTGIANTRYASLSWGVFDEEITNKPVERYGKTLFNTKTKKISSFDSGQILYNGYNFDPVVFALNVDPLAHSYPSISPYTAFAGNPILYKDEDGREPVKSQAGTVNGFVAFFNTTSTRMGTLAGSAAGDAMIRLSKIKIKNFIKPEPATTAPFNNIKDRYIYTEKGGWVDMAHFLFYAGRAYKYKKDGANLPMRDAIQDGYHQEFLDQIFSKHSAYSYEDLPSDKIGAEFGAYYFDPKSELTLGEQVEQYLQNKLAATDPKNAPNYNRLPEKDSQTRLPSETNKTTNPMHTKPASKDKQEDGKYDE